VAVRGPPGLGKTTGRRSWRAELGVQFHSTSGPVIRQRRAISRVQITNLEAAGVCSSRDSPSQTQRSKNSLSGDGGLSASTAFIGAGLQRAR